MLYYARLNNMVEIINMTATSIKQTLSYTPAQANIFLHTLLKYIPTFTVCMTGESYFLYDL